MKFSALEKRWLNAVMEAVLPAGASKELPWGAGDTRVSELTEDMIQRTPFLGAMGLRASLWVTYLFPLFIMGKPRTIAGLSSEVREEYLKKLYEHPIYFVRQTLILIKSVACMAYCVDERVREKLGMNAPSRLPGAGRGQ